MERKASKGTRENPYSMSECEKMLDTGTWPGGYVKDDAGQVSYVMKSVTVQGYSGSCSGSNWHGSDFEFCSGSYEWHEPDTDNKGCDEEGKGTPSDNGNGGTSTGGNTGGGTGGGHYSHGSYSVGNAVSYLISHATETYISGKNGHCARAVREPLEAGGLSIVGHPFSACEYDSFLPKVGFHSVNKVGYAPEKGDIVVLEAVSGHPYGHIAMYTGSQWVSDFKQSDMWGGSAYRNKAEYTLWRR